MKINYESEQFPKIMITTCIHQIEQGNIINYKVLLVNGKPFDRISILNRFSRLDRINWDILSVRLCEDVTDKEMEFGIYNANSCSSSKCEGKCTDRISLISFRLLRAWNAFLSMTVYDVFRYFPSSILIVYCYIPSLWDIP